MNSCAAHSPWRHERHERHARHSAKILARKAEEIAERQQMLSLRELRGRIERLPAPRPFLGQLTRTIATGRPAVIAEIKRASPSKGLLRDPFEPAAIAQSYAAAGAPACRC